MIKEDGMKLLVIIGVIVGMIVLVELFKHHFTKGLMKYMVLFFILLLVLLVASAYIDFGQFIGRGSTFAETGSAIAEGVEKDLEGLDLKESETIDKVSKKAEEFFENLFDA